MAHRKNNPNRDYTLRVRLFGSQRDQIREAAEALSFTMSDFARTKLLRASARVVRRKGKLPPNIAELTFQISAVGNNLNQLTRFAHDGQLDAVRIHAVLSELQAILTGFHG